MRAILARTLSPWNSGTDPQCYLERCCARFGALSGEEQQEIVREALSVLDEQSAVPPRFCGEDKEALLGLFASPGRASQLSVPHRDALKRVLQGSAFRPWNQLAASLDS